MKDKWEKEFYEFGHKVYFDWDGKPEVLVDYVRSLLTSQKERMVEMIRGMRKKEGKHDNHATDDDSWCYTCDDVIEEGQEPTSSHGYNQALDDIIKKIEAQSIINDTDRR